MIPTVRKQREINTVSKDFSAHSLFSSAWVHVDLSLSNFTGTMTVRLTIILVVRTFQGDRFIWQKLYKFCDK